MGRWNRKDPLGEKGGINLYGFIDNDPIGSIDLLGLKKTVSGTFLLEAKKIIYKDLAKIHFTESDIFIEDLTALQVTYPNKFVKNNFNKTEIQINGKEYKVLMQKQTEGFEAMIRLICVEDIQ